MDKRRYGKYINLSPKQITQTRITSIDFSAETVQGVFRLAKLEKLPWQINRMLYFYLSGSYCWIFW